MNENRDIIIINDTAVSTMVEEPRCRDGSSIDDLINEFVRAKVSRTQSVKTARAYYDTVTSFRLFLHHKEYDLIMYTSEKEGRTDYAFIRARIAAFASDFALLSKKPGKFVTESTRNQRLAILSSFYQYADQHAKIPFANPIDIVERSPVEAYAGALAINAEDARHGLERIDRGKLQGKRDYALLQVLLNTGVRVGQVQRLTWGDLQVARDGTVTIIFRHMKGNKTAEKELDAKVSSVLLDYLHALYGKNLNALSRDKPLWIILTDIPAPKDKDGNPHYQKGDPLKYQAIRYLCNKYLKTSKVHATRHTFGVLLMEDGATLDEVQEQLNHNDPKVTQRYIKHFSRQKNRHAAAIAARLGL